MSKIIALLTVSVFLMLSFSSCSVIEKDAEQLMGAPLHTDDSSAIIEAVEQYTARNVALVYPSQSSQSNPINLFNSGKNAMVLCKNNHNIDCVYLQLEEKWKVVNIINLSAESILTNKLEWFDNGEGFLLFYTKDGKTCLDVLTVNKQLKRQKSIECDFYLTCDFDADTKQELSVFVDDKIEIYNIDGQVKLVTGLDYAVNTQKSNIITGKLFDEVNALFIDNNKNGNIKTDVFYLKNGQLINLVDEDMSISHFDENIVCRDIDADGYIEVPFVEIMPSYQQDDAIYFTSYKRYNSVEFEDVLSGDFDFDNGYYINYPDKWLDSVTVEIDEQKSTRSYFSYSTEQDKIGTELLKIKVYTKQELDSVDKTNIIQLAENGDKVYTARIINKLNKYAIDSQQISEMFGLIK